MFTIDTGEMRARVSKHHAHIIESLTIGDRIVAQNATLIAIRGRPEPPGVLRDIEMRGDIERATLEQSGPVRAVVKQEGRMIEPAANGGRVWLPFTVRLTFFAGSGEIQLTHSFVFDGDGNKDFLKGLGLSFEVPFKEELHNRHVRFAGDGDGV